MTQKIAGDLAPRPNLEHLKHQARSLLKAARAGSPHALSRLQRAHALPARGAAEIRLAEAQLAIARENGASTWTELRAAVESAPPPEPATGAAPEIQRVGQIWLDVSDLAAAREFYGGRLGLKLTGEVPGAMLFYDCGGTSLLLGLRAEIRPNSVLYFQLPGTEAALQGAYNRLKRAGGRVGDSPHCIARNWQGADIWLAFFFDPAGNQLAFKADLPARS